MWGLMVILFLTFCAEGVAQFDSTYVPGRTHSWKSKVLLARLNGQVHNELDRNGLTEEMLLTKHYRELYDNLRKQVRDSSFLDNKKVQWLLDDTFRRLREGNPTVRQTPMTLLAYLQPLPNAYCVGEGTFLVTTGMLARLQSQSQLAAVLAHELAHYELNHSYKGIQLIEAMEQKAGRGAPRTASGDPVVDKMLKLQEQTARLFEVHRKWELEADSLGFVFFSNAGFRQSEYLTMLAVLDPESAPIDNPPSAFFEPINFIRYPFNDAWLRPRAGIYGKSPWGFFLPEDLLRTHPEILKRATKLLPRVAETGQLNFVQDSYIREVRYAALLESVIAGSRMRLLDIALYEILSGLHEIPNNSYMVTAMGRLLLRSAMVINDNLLIYYQPTRTLGYDGRMLLTNYFINNVTYGELLELGYHFMNKKENFHPETEEHYYLLSRFCQMSRRNETRKGVEAEYLRKYPKGQYRKLMKGTD